MPIYTRDNINYGGMLQAALQNKARQIERDYDNYMKQPLAWSNAVANSGKIAQDTMFKIAGNYYDQDKIAQQQAFQASEAEKRALEAMERQKEQQKFQEAQNELNRQNTMDIAKLNKDIAASDKEIERDRAAVKLKLEAELAQAEYDDAISKVDLAKPETVLAAKKAAIKLNYANRNLPYYADDPKSFTVPVEFTQDAEPVAIAKKVNSAIQVLDPIIAAPQKQWTKEQKQAYADAFDVIKQYKPELITKYQIEEKKKGKTNETLEAEYQAALKDAGDNAYKIRQVKQKYGRK